MSDHRYPSLRFDPAPGDARSIFDLCWAARRVATELGVVTTGLVGLRQVSACWQGDAAVEFTRSMRELPASLDAAHRAFDMAGAALATYGDELLVLQAEARRAERDAEAALARLQAMTGGTYPSLAGYSYTRRLAHESGTDGGAAAAQAQHDLDAAREEGRRVQARAADAAQAAETAVRRATEYAPAPGLLQNLNNGLGDWVRNNPELLKLVADVAGVVGLLAMFVPVVALMAATVAVLATGALALYADGSGTDVALAAAGLVTGGLAAGAARRALAARNAATGLAEKKLPSLLKSGSIEAGEAPWRMTKVQLDQASLGFSVHGVASTIERHRSRTPPSPPPLRLAPRTPATAQAGRCTTPRHVQAPVPTTQRDRATAGTASGR